MKRFLSIILAVSILLAVCVMPVGAQEAVMMSQMQTKDIITITVDGNYVDCASYGQMPVIVEGRTLVPLRSVFEALGAEVLWDNDTRSVKSVKGDITVVLAVDSKEMAVNGAVKTLDVPAQIMNERTMVPVRAVAEAFGANVSWNNETRTVVITTANTEETPEKVVKAAYDAMLNLDIETGKNYYKNPEAEMGDLAGVTSIADMAGMVAGGEDLTEEQLVLVEEFTKRLMHLVSYEVTDVRVMENTAEVHVATYTPDFENMDIEAYLTEEAIALLMMEILTEMGYSMEDIANVTAEDEAIITTALTAGLFEYIISVFEIEAQNAETIVTESVEKLEKIDGKWLIVE